MEQKKTIRINFVDYWPGFPALLEQFKDQPDEFPPLRILKKHFNVIICDDADYVFFSSYKESHWTVPDSAIKIYHTVENLAPDFNACDYAIGFEWMEYEDRYIRIPNYMFYSHGILEKMCHKHEVGEGWDYRAEKKDFCSFVVSNPLNPRRAEVFDALSRYKRVDSGGRFLNNIGGPVDDKLAFQSTHKFSICFENGSHNGYTTEKLMDAFAARTVPIYWGDPEVNRVFNPKSFINASDYASLDDLVEEIRQIDNDDQRYLSMIREPAMLPSAPTIDEELGRFEKWLVPIFERPIQESYRRNREMHGRWYIDRRQVLALQKSRSEILLKSILYKQIAGIERIISRFGRRKQ